MTNLVMLIGPGRYRLTRQALESLVFNTIPTEYNLTIVLDSPDFRTAAFVQGISNESIPPAVTVLDITNSNHTLSQLKNIGVMWSEQRFGRGEWLYISDSDVYFTQSWLGTLTMTAEASEKDGFRLWGGQVHPFHQPINKWHRSMSFMLDEVSVLDGPSWLMRWGTWDQCGPFVRTTAPGVCQSEEYPFCENLLKNGGARPFCDRLTTEVMNAGISYIGPDRIGVIHPHVVYHTGLTHLNGQDCVGRKEREAMIPKSVVAE